MSSSAADNEALLKEAVARAQALAKDPLEEAPEQFHKLRNDLVISLLSTSAPVYALAKGAKRETFARDLEIIMSHAQSLSTSLSVLAWRYKFIYEWLSKVSGITAITALLGELFTIGNEIAANHGAIAPAIPGQNAA